MTLTAEQRRAIERAGDEPIRIEDPESHAAYVLLRAEVFDRLRPPIMAEQPEGSLHLDVSEGFRRSKQAFLRDLPELLARKRLRGRWALYRGDQRIGIWRNPQGMQRRILKLGLGLDEYYANVIEPYEEPDEIDTSFLEYDL